MLAHMWRLNNSHPYIHPFVCLSGVCVCVCFFFYCIRCHQSKGVYARYLSLKVNSDLWHSIFMNSRPSETELRPSSIFHGLSSFLFRGAFVKTTSDLMRHWMKDNILLENVPLRISAHVFFRLFSWPFGSFWPVCMLHSDLLHCETTGNILVCGQIQGIGVNVGSLGLMDSFSSSSPHFNRFSLVYF